MQYDVNMVNMYLYIIYLYQRQNAFGNIFKVNTDIKHIYAQKKCNLKGAREFPYLILKYRYISFEKMVRNERILD